MFKTAQEKDKLTKEISHLQAKLTKLTDIHEAILTKLLNNIYDLEKHKILTKGYQKGLTKSLQKIRFQFLTAFCIKVRTVLFDPPPYSARIDKMSDRGTVSQDCYKAEKYT
jgi:hypothetical protein